MMRYRITPLAARHLKDIARYTAQTWGKQKRNAYIYDIRARIEWLCENPGYGTRRREIGADIFSYPQGNHIIFCRLSSDHIDVIGVLHERMDYPENLPKP
jgi:toxin ParE1/3/4